MKSQGPHFLCPFLPHPLNQAVAQPIRSPLQPKAKGPSSSCADQSVQAWPIVARCSLSPDEMGLLFQGLRVIVPRRHSASLRAAAIQAHLMEFPKALGGGTQREKHSSLRGGLITRPAWGPQAQGQLQGRAAGPGAHRLCTGQEEALSFAGCAVSVTAT